MKNTFIDEVVIANADVDACYAKVADINTWTQWCTAVSRAGQLSRGQLRRGSLFYFSPKVGKLPPAPLLVSVLSANPGKEISWGVKIGKMELIHRLVFSSLPDGRTQIHHSEWSTHLLAPLTRPLNKLFLRFNTEFSQSLCESLNGV